MLTTLAEVKTALNIKSTEFDTQLTLLITLADEAIEQYCGRKFAKDDYVYTLENLVINNNGDYAFRVPNIPMSELQSITITPRGNQTPITLDVTKADANLDTGVIRYCYTLPLGQINPRIENYYKDARVSIAYEGGYDAEDLPASLRLAAIDAVTNAFLHFYPNRVKVNGVDMEGEITKISIGDHSIQKTAPSERLKTRNNDAFGVMFTSTTRSLLAPFRRINIG